MELYRNENRTLKTRDLIATMNTNGAQAKNLGKYCKWKEVSDGRIQVSLTVYEMDMNGIIVYILSDSLGRVACPVQGIKEEVLGWLKDHGFKTERDWYLQDYGMTEETWNDWNEA